MKRLEDIPKKNIYQVPDGYFDDLPTIIQARVTEKAPSAIPSFAHQIRYAIPVMALAILSVVWVFTEENSENALSAEQLLASVETSSLIAYLEESEMTTDELLENVSFSQEDVSAIESDVYDLDIEQDDLDELINEYQLDLDNF
jgi:hypothetical protein